MPIKVKCSNCDKVLSVPDAARGKAIKCPQCQTRIAVPAEEASPKSTSKSTSAKSKAKKPSAPVDSETALATFDIRSAEDTEARVCSKCGYDMKYQDEDDTECPQCGFDSAQGGLGAKAKKKAMKGPDPADFYPGLVKESWKFVGKNIKLAWRTVAYTLVSLLVACLCAMLYLYISMWPPRIFLALCFFVSFFVIPGWMWLLDTEVIKLTLERKDKFKKLNFDFFLASAMGAAFVFWSIAVAMPLLAVPAGLGYVLVNFAGMPSYVLPICLGIGLIPAIWVLPVSMSHMAMPVQYRGWQFWKVIQIWSRNIKPLSYWMTWFLITNIPNFAGTAVIAGVYGTGLSEMVRDMEFNADLERKKFAATDNPNARKKGQAAPAPVKLPDPKTVNFMPLLVPGVILIFMALFNGFTCMFNMRTNGQFTYYNKGSLELIDKSKDYKYKAKEVVDEDADEKPKKMLQLAIDAIVFLLMFDLVGLIGGMMYGTLTDFGPMKGILVGLSIGSVISAIVVFFQCVALSFQNSVQWGIITLLTYPIGFIVFVFKNWEERKIKFVSVMASILITLIVVIVSNVIGAYPFLNKSDAAGQPPATQRPAEGAHGAPAATPAAPGAQPGMAPGQPAIPAGSPPATQ